MIKNMKELEQERDLLLEENNKLLEQKTSGEITEEEWKHKREILVHNYKTKLIIILTK